MGEANILLELQQNWLFLEAKRKEDANEIPLLTLESPDGTVVAEQMVDSKGRRCVLFPIDEQGPEDRDSAGIIIVNHQMAIESDVRSFLMVRCELIELGKIFNHVSAQMITEVFEKPAEPGPACLSVLGKWRELLKSVQFIEPDQSQIIGAIGEMLIVENIVKRDPQRRGDIWVGSEGQRHDLRRGVLAVEVKTTTSNESKAVIIHGADQLVAPDGGSLYLAFVRLESVPDGMVSISSMVQRLCELGIPAERVHSGLQARGISPGTWMDERFDLREISVYPVNEEFPRITPSRFLDSKIPLGVSGIRYRIDLSVADPPLEGSAEDALFDSLASA